MTASSGATGSRRSRDGAAARLPTGTTGVISRSSTEQAGGSALLQHVARHDPRSSADIHRARTDTEAVRGQAVRLQMRMGGPRDDWARRMAGTKMSAAPCSTSAGVTGAVRAAVSVVAKAVVAPAENTHAG